MRRADGFASLLAVLDNRAKKFGPDRTGLMGEYLFSAELGTHAVQLDTGQLIPNPVITTGVSVGNRYPCLWMQGGHDILVLAIPQ